MTKTNELEPISEARDLDFIKSEFNRLVRIISKDPEIELETAEITRRRWTAVPVESSDHFDEEQADSISAAMLQSNSPYFYAYSPQVNHKGDPKYFKVKSTRSSLLELSGEWWWSEFVIISPSREFAILCTKRDYYVVAGSTNFVERAMGMDIPTGRKAWYDYAMDFINHGGFSVKLGNWYLKAAKYYDLP